MKKIILFMVLTCLIPVFLLAAENETDQSAFKNVKTFIDKKRGVNPKTFKTKNGEIKIKLDASKLNFQIIYDTVPNELTSYLNNPGESIYRSIRIQFLSKSGSAILKAECALDKLSWQEEGNTNHLVCKDSIACSALDYSRIDSITTSVGSYSYFSLSESK